MAVAGARYESGWRGAINQVHTNGLFLLLPLTVGLTSLRLRWVSSASGRAGDLLTRIQVIIRSIVGEFRPARVARPVLLTSININLSLIDFLSPSSPSFHEREINKLFPSFLGDARPNVANRCTRNLKFFMREYPKVPKYSWKTTGRMWISVPLKLYIHNFTISLVQNCLRIQFEEETECQKIFNRVILLYNVSFSLTVALERNALARIKIKLRLNLTNVDGPCRDWRCTDAIGLNLLLATCSNLNDTMTITINIYSVKKAHVTHERRATRAARGFGDISYARPSRWSVTRKCV